MTSDDELWRLRAEARKLRQDIAVAERGRDAHQKRNQTLADKITTLQQEKKTLEQEKEELIKENNDLKILLSIAIEKTKKYAGMIFKKAVRNTPSGAKRGAKPGHAGSRRAQPDRIDKEKRVFLTQCPDCDTPLNRTESCDTRIVEDIPVSNVIVTRYEIERQWCVRCRKEARGIPENTLPGFQIGQNALVCILFLKYRLRAPLSRISDYLASQHGLALTQGGIQRILHSFKKRFGPEYARILDEIRLAPVKHADETSWRILGEKGWAWLFSTRQAACPSYFSLPMPQQSCWTHLLRVSREEMEKNACSEEMKILHAELGALFGRIDGANSRPFVKTERTRAHAGFLREIDSIIARLYEHSDALAVQTRIRNQRTHLIEALLHENAPLTNNHAERMIRPLVVTRKISGGSRSDAGAATHAVNMTVMQTLSLRKINFFDGIRAIIHAGNPRYVTGSG